MAFPWSVALRAVPWGMILANALTIAKAAESLLSGAKARREPLTSSHELQGLQHRVSALEKHDHANAELLKQMADQIETLTKATEVLAARQRWLLAFVIVSAAVSVLALAMVVARW